MSVRKSPPSRKPKALPSARLESIKKLPMAPSKAPVPSPGSPAKESVASAPLVSPRVEAAYSSQGHSGGVSLPGNVSPQGGTLKVLFVASECAPFVKTGGLGDVVGALPKVLRRMGLDARVVLPLYSSIDRERFRLQFVSSACIHMGHGEENWVGIYSSLLDDEVPVWFVDYDRFFGRPGIYHDGAGEYLDNAYRFALLSKAALQICKDQNFIPEVMHCHDWPTSLVPVFLKTWDRILSPLSNTATVLTIHNIGYQGVYDPSVMRYLGLGDEHYRSDTLEDHGKVNLLKAGVAFADALTTVSPTHAVEILDPVGGCGLAPYLERRRGDLTGILNGVDEEHWNPSSDKLIPARFSASDMSGKIECKRELQRRFGLKVDDSVPLFGVITRFAHQKGMDLLIEASRPALDRMALQLVVLGSGDRHVEDYFRWLPSAYPGRVGSYIGFSNELSHLIEAGSDFFLMPSFYEPCGLNQMYSLKYGTLPVVRATGGLNDSVENYDERTGEGTGFKFFLPTGEALHDTIGWAVSTWFDRPHHIQAMRKRGMEKRFGWENSARKYVEVYRAAIRKKVG